MFGSTASIFTVIEGSQLLKDEGSLAACGELEMQLPPFN
jgi:hypothetical protein